METRKFGKTDMQVSVLGFGGAEIGFQRIAQKEVDRLLGTALDAGLNVVDTAACYIDSETKIGQAIGRRRGDFYLFSKCGHRAPSFEPDWTKKWLLESMERSLKNLQTDVLDLVQLHSCDEDVLRAGEAIAALQEARDRGLIRYLGYSGDGEAARYAVECGAFDTLQTSLSIADQEAVDLTLPRAREAGMGVITKRPIANAAWRTGKRPENPYHHSYWNRLQALDYPFAKPDELTDSIGTALRFTLGVPGVHTAIVGTTKPGRWQENAALLEAGPLPRAAFDAIRARWAEVAQPDWVGLT